MVFCRQGLLIVTALILGGGPLVAADTREERAYAAALAAFHDQFYDRAGTGLEQFLQTYRKSTNAPQALLLLAQSEFQRGKFSEAIARLAAPDTLAKARAAGLADQYLYWTAEAQFAQGDFQAAADNYLAVAGQFPASPLGLSAVVAAAAAFEKLGQWKQVDDLLDNPNGRFQQAAQRNATNDPVASGRLLQAESKCSQTNYEAAIRLLNLLNPARLTPEQAWRRAHQLYQAHLQLDDWDAALAAATNLLEIAHRAQGGFWLTNLAESVACRAGALEKQGNLTNAMAAWQENLASGVPGEQQQRAILKLAELAAGQNNLAEAERGLETFLAQYPDVPAAELARLTLAELHLKHFAAQPAATNHLAAAQAQLEQLPGAASASPLAGKILMARGWCQWLAGKYSESLASFSAAALRLPPSEELAVARFKMGDAQFALTNFAGALTNYQAVRADFSGLANVASSLDDRALYQILWAELALTNLAGAESAMGELLARFPASEWVTNSLLLLAEGAADMGSSAKVAGLCHQFEQLFPDSPLTPQAAFATGRAYEREQNWPMAVAHHENWLRRFPTNELRPQVEYARDWAVFQTGDEARAFGLFTNFIVQYPAHPLKPLAHWWVADHYFRLGGTNFVDAEMNYELIFQDFPTNELAYPAQLMAGRAALGRFGYKDASGYFYALISTNAPADLAVKARFGYCEALRQMSFSDTNNANLQQATNILAQLCPLAPTNQAGALAWSEIGDCDLQLGALDAATNAYAEVLMSPAASQELRNRARFGWGLVLEKKAEGLAGDDRKTLLAMALNAYLDVIDFKAEDIWTKKAGLQALPLISRVGSGDKNAFFDRLEKLFPQLKAALEKKRLAPAN